MTLHAGPLLAVLIIEALFGYPRLLLRHIGHPVMAVGALIAALDRRWNRGSARRLKGIVALAVLLLLGGVAGWLLAHLLPYPAQLLLTILLATTGLAQRGLYDHVRAVAAPLMQGDLDAARLAVARIVGRDTETLDEQGVAAAAIETLAESFCDGVVAPAFWFLIAGLPGLFAFKCVSTADSMIGHQDSRHGEFGWASARMDDVMNWIPARLAALFLCLVGGGWRIMVRDGARHLSPNAGWPESAMAGALKVQLGGGAYYDGEWIARQTLGEGPRPDVGDIVRALRIYVRACLVLWVVTGGLAWLR